MSHIKYLVFCCVFFCVVSIGWTAPYVGSSPTPINNVQLKYDVTTQILHIEANHVTTRPNKNFIRKVVIIKNSKETQTFTFSRQSTASKFIENINYEAVPGDVLVVELWGSLGGKGSGTLEVSIQTEEKTDAQEALQNGK